MIDDLDKRLKLNSAIMSAVIEVARQGCPTFVMFDRKPEHPCDNCLKVVLRVVKMFAENIPNEGMGNIGEMRESITACEAAIFNTDVTK